MRQVVCMREECSVSVCVENGEWSCAAVGGNSVLRFVEVGSGREEVGTNHRISHNRGFSSLTRWQRSEKSASQQEN